MYVGFYVGGVVDFLFKGGCGLVSGYGENEIGVKNKMVYWIDGLFIVIGKG